MLEAKGGPCMAIETMRDLDQIREKNRGTDEKHFSPREISESLDCRVSIRAIVVQGVGHGMARELIERLLHQNR
jgi:hypothetical protein